MDFPGASGESPGPSPAGGGAPSSKAAPDRIGPFQILEVLGEGGMGIVYLAEQTEPVRRRVAIKLIKLGMDTEHVIARFETERQALAMMNHPNIARVYEAGATESGRPYFVMEPVLGVPITEYLDSKRLTIPERLEIFQQVCHGVQHAHQKGIIHRDLKPSNVLVTTVEGKVYVKIIDFGLARATNQRLTERTLFTRTGQLVGTPEYMSPEQAEITAAGVDTRTDIYSLGVILYEIISGMLPFSVKELRRSGWDEIRRKIREDEPSRPSAKASSSGDLGPVLAKRRRTDTTTLVRRLRGDLDWITMKAIDKDPMRRYDTASELAADIQRHLRDEPVLAGPPSATYRLGKFVRKNRLAVGAAALVTLALLGGLVGTTTMSWQAKKARIEAQDERDAARAARSAEEEQRRSAEQEAEKARAISEFIQGMLGSANPEARGKDVKVADVLESASRDLETSFSELPEVEAALRNTLGRTYLTLGLYPEGEPHLRKALEIRRRLLGEDAPETLETMGHLALLLTNTGDYPAAEMLLRETLAARRRVLGEEHRQSLGAMNDLGQLLRRQGKLADAEALYRQALETARPALGEEDPDTLSMMHNLAVLLRHRGQLDEAEGLYKRVLEIRRRILGDEHPDTIGTIGSLGVLYRAKGDLEQAEPYYREAHEARRRLLGEEHPGTLQALSNLATFVYAAGKADEGYELSREAVEKLRRVLGADHPSTLKAVSNLAYLLKNEGRLEEAEPMTREAWDARRRVLGDDHPDTIVSMHNYASLLETSGDMEDATKLFRRVLADRRRVLGEEHPKTIASMGNLADILFDGGAAEEAERVWAETIALAEAVFREGDWRPPHYRVKRGVTLTTLERLDEAEIELRRGYEALREILGDDHPRTRTAAERLADLHVRRGEPEKAEELRSPATPPDGD